MKKRVVFILAILMLVLTSCLQKPYTIEIENKSSDYCFCKAIPLDDEKEFQVNGNSVITKTLPFGVFIRLSDDCKRFFIEQESENKIIINTKPKHQIRVENKTNKQQKISSIPFKISNREKKLYGALFSDITINPSPDVKNINVFYNSKQELINNGFFCADIFSNVIYIPNENKIIIKNKTFCK